MPSSWFKDELLWREIVAVLEQAGRRDLVKRAEQSRRGRRPTPEIAYRQLKRMWISYRKRHKGTDEELARKFYREQGHQLRKLGLKIGRKIDPKRGPWASLRDAIFRGKRESARVKSRRQSSSQFMRHAFGRRERQTIRLGLGRIKQTVDRAMAEYLLAQEMMALGKKPTAVF